MCAMHRLQLSRWRLLYRLLSYISQNQCGCAPQTKVARIFFFFLYICMNNKAIIGREIFLPNIIFGFDENWELQNWYDTCTKEATYGLSSGNKWGLGNIPPDVPKIIAKAKSTEDALNKAKIILVEFLKTSEASHQIQETSERAQKRWNKIASEYFLRLSKMLDVPIKDFEKKYYAFFTFSRRCPFSKGKFMFNQFNDFSNNAAHEIMHIEKKEAFQNYNFII